MKDIVLEGFVKDFAEEKGLADLDESTVFEAFAVSSTLRKYHQFETSDPEDLLTGGGGDAGIDAAAILVNGYQARTQKDVEYYISKLPRLDVEFVFIQAKTSATFNAGSIGTFVHGVIQFFTPTPAVPFRDELERLRKVKNFIYQKSIALQRNPSCALYYVSAGSWEDAPEPKDRLVDGKVRLEATHFFRRVDAMAIDAERLKTIYRELKRGVVKEVEFSKNAVFPRIDGVREAYIGLLRGDQFIRMVTTEEDRLNRELFYDNVRDFQGANAVNREIAQTIAKSDSRGRFPLLNNGVTIVARSINRTGDVFRLSDFQIVNGCQTTHMLYENRGHVDSIFIPVKLVVTDESDVITEVIKATNRQTAVLPEALESLTPFHKELEDYYVAQEAPREKQDRVHYERRSKQYAFEKIKVSQIVTLATQTKSFVAMFFNEPHRHPDYYGELLDAYEDRLFLPDQRPSAYYASGVALLAVEHLFSSRALDRTLKRWKYHILMLLRVQFGGPDTPALNSNRMDDYARRIVAGLRSEDSCRESCQKALQLIILQLSKQEGGSGDDPSRAETFTTQLINALRPPSKVQKSQDTEPILGAKETGMLLWYDDWRNFGFIRRDTGGDIFVHRTGIDSVPWQNREAGTRVTYTVAQGRGSFKADNVRVLPTQ
jgi:cold shock CspA family protein